MVTWQRRSSLRSLRVIGITALGGPLFFLLSPFTGPPAGLPRSLAVLGRLERGYAELRLYGVLGNTSPGLTALLPYVQTLRWGAGKGRRAQGMRRVVLMLATMSLAILLASGVAHAIVNGEPDDNRHPYVGALVAEFEGEGGETELVPVCSGTLISPTVFLTAGHCTEFLIAEDLPTYVSFDPTFVAGESELVSGTPSSTPTTARLRSSGRRVAPGLRRGGGRPGRAGRDGHLRQPARRELGRYPTEALTPHRRRVRCERLLHRRWCSATLPRHSPNGHRRVLGHRGVGQPSRRRRVHKNHWPRYGTRRGGHLLRRLGPAGLLGGPDTVVGINSFIPPSSFPCSGPAYAQRVDLPVVLEWVSSFL